MKICHVTNCIPGYHYHVGGGERSTYVFCKILSKNGHEISVLATMPDKGMPDKGTPKESFEFFGLPRIEDYVPKFISLYIEAIKHYALQYDPIAYHSAKNIINKLKPDILHFNSVHFLTHSLISIAKKMRIPTVLSIYDYWLFCPLSTLFDYQEKICRLFNGTWCTKCLPKKFVPVQKLLLGYRKTIIDYYLNKIDRFLVFSNSSASILRDYGIDRSRISIIPIVNYEKINFPPDRRMEPNTILFVGWIQPRKGLHVLLKAIPKILASIPDAKLYVVGNKVKFGAEYEKLISNLIDNLNLKDRVFLHTGLLPRNVLLDYFYRANVVVICEQWENMSPLILTEMMSFEKPIVASNIGGFPEFIKEGYSGYLAKTTDPEDFAEKIIKILKDRTRAVEMGKNAAKVASEMFSEEKIYNGLNEIYESLNRRD